MDDIGNNGLVRILHVFGALNRGGAETMIMNLYNKMNKEDIQFDFVIHTEEKCDYEEEIYELGGAIYRCPKFYGANVLDYINWWKKFFKIHKEYHILHSHVRSTASIYLSIAKKNGVKTIQHSHSVSNGNGIRARIKDVMQLPIRFQADYLFACSREAGEWLFGRNCIKKSNYKEIRNAFDVEKFRFNIITRREMREKNEIDNKFVIGHVGRFVYPKNHKFLLDVFEEYQKRDSESVLLMIGEGELKREVEEIVLRKKMENNVIFLNSVSEIEKYYQVMDCFVFPSLYEGLGMAFIEAQASGLPCIGSTAIPREIKFSSNTSYLSIEEGVCKWADEIYKLKNKKRDEATYKNIKIAGYDIEESQRWLYAFYRGC